jgi:enoyl-CoA hydratase
MPFRTLSLEKRGAIAYLALCRGDPGNVLDGLFARELGEACAAIGDDAEVRAVILSGGQAPVFSVGWDWSLLAGDDPLATARAQGLPGDPFGCLAQLARPVVCAFNGDAFSAGLELALACDVRVAAQGARFGFPEVALGLMPLAGGAQRLARLVGRGRALEMVLTGEPIDAQEALRVGLVSRLARAEELMADSEAVADAIAQRGPIAIRYAKEAVSRGLDMTLEQALRYETDLTIILQTTEDRAEGVRAFLEKRKPQFRGR